MTDLPTLPPSPNLSQLEKPSAPRRRGWYQSVAGKLLVAFAIIVNLTIAATILSLLRFGTIDEVITRLVGVSMPAMKSSLEVQSKATEVTVTATQLSGAQDSTQLFERNTRALDEIQELWARLAKLRSIVGDDDATKRLQGMIAVIDQRVGELYRETNGNIDLTNRREKLIAQSSAAADKIDPLLRAASSTLTFSDDVAEAIYRTRVQVSTIAALLSQAATATRPERLVMLRNQYQAARTQLDRDLATIAGSGRTDTAAGEALTQATQALLALGEGNDGVFVLRRREQDGSQNIDTIQSALQSAGSQLRDEILSLVAQAEEESAKGIARSNEAIASSRLWLMLIAAASLILAGLIVWQFVMRYVVARLTGLADSMLAIAQGQLAAPIPAAGPDELGDMSRALVVFRNNAAEIRAAKEEAERAREEAEAASRTKSAFLANMSHELRTPLNAIIGYSEILVEDATDRGDEGSVDDLQKIQSAGKHLLGLINDILDLSKIEAGRMDVYLEQVFITRLVDEVKTIVEPMMSKQGNRLIIECESNIGSLRTDLTKLKQSLLNLLSNAAKFTEGGNVKLAVTRTTTDDVSKVSFAVTDSGIGMNESQVARLFQAFTQADASTTRNFGGTGLGLTITKHFCTMLGGTVGVTSQPGVGSTFTIVLPDETAVASAAPMELRVDDSNTASADAITVLVVDDDPVVHEILSSTLSREGYKLLHATDGAEALELMRRSPPDIITLDVMMPKIDGWSVLGTMKSEPALAHIPVIMLTIVDDRTLGFSLGASEFMTKPIDRTRLITLLRQFAPQSGDALVLIVDDNPDVRGMVRHTIEGVGLQAAEAGNGAAALQYLATHPAPSLILLDLMMPEVDGFTFLERMREDKALADVPVVVLTAKELTADERAFLTKHTMLVLSKSAQPIGSLGAALAAISRRGDAKMRERAAG